MPSQYLPTLYKERRVPAKSPCGAICVNRTRGRTRGVRLTHGVSVWLCDGHAGLAFQTQRSSRDFVRTLSGVWEANGYAEGVGPDGLAAPVHRRYERCPAHPPSLRTLQRWHAQRRCLVDRPP
ncbi:MAG TPA: hypothetical protein VE777_14020 [Gaiellales bacterium]|nr:hypothetical protein [Gaiellales bacterium]